MINELTKLTIKLIQQPSITPHDGFCQTIIAQYLKKLNFNIEHINFDNTHNVWAYRQGSSKNFKEYNTLLFLGHTDVVSPGNIQDWIYPPFSGIIKKNILYGRGASDMKGAIAAMLVATKYFVQQHPKHRNRIAFLFTSNEEGTGLNGTTKVVDILLNRHERIEYCIIGEPSSKFKLGDVIKNGRRGSYTGRLIIYGSSGHVAYPQFLKNPIHLSIPALSDLLNTSWDAKDSVLFPPTSMQITNIYTDSINNNNNVTPNQLILKFNFRFNDQSSTYFIQNNIKQILSTYHLVCNIDSETISAPYFSVPGKLTNIVTDTIKCHQNITPKLETTGGTSDGRFIIKMKSEIIELGALNCTIHKINECINLIDLELLSVIYLKIMKKILL